MTDERPDFLLKGTDPFAAYLVRLWAKLARSAGVIETKVASAERIASRMQRWTVKKLPD